MGNIYACAGSSQDGAIFADGTSMSLVSSIRYCMARITATFCMAFLGCSDGDPATEQTQTVSQQTNPGPRAASEFSQTRAFLLSYEILTTKNGTEFMKLLLGAHVPEIWLLVPPVEGRDLADTTLLENAQREIGVEDYQRVKEVPWSLAKTAMKRVWTRDYGPLTVLGPGNQSTFVSFVSVDFVSNEKPTPISQILAQQFGVEHRDIPLHFEPGDFLIDEFGACLITKKSLQDNQLFFQNTAKAKIFFSSNFGCTNLVTVDVPDTWASHVDLYVKFTGSKNILVTSLTKSKELRKKIRDFAKHDTPSEGEDTKAMLEKLNNMDRALASLRTSLSKQLKGYTIIDLPMSVKINESIRSEYKEHQLITYRRKFRSLDFAPHANAVLVEKRLAVVPTYSFTDQQTQNDVVNAYVKGGYSEDSVKLLDAEDLMMSPYSRVGYGGGAWHCASMHIPALPASPCEVQ